MSKSINYLSIGLVALLLATAPAAHATSKSAVIEAQRATKMARMRVLFQQAYAKIDAENYQGAEEGFSFIIADADFPLLPPEQKYSLYCLLAKAQSELDKNDKAYDNLMLAAAAAPVARSDFYWSLLWDVSSATKNAGSAIDAMTALALSAPKNLNDFYEPFVAQTLRNAKALPDGQARREKALEALWKGKYRPHAFDSAEPLWFDLFEIEVAKGDETFARTIAATFHSPQRVIQLRSDKRYRRYADELNLDFAKAQADELAQHRMEAERNPQKIEGILIQARDLMKMNRLPEALTMLDEAISRVNAAPKDKPAFDDLNDQLHWVLNMRTRILEKMGRSEDSLETQRKSRDEAAARSHDIVSQNLNLAGYYSVNGKPKEALEEMKNFKPETASPYGVMVAEGIRVCASSDLGDTATVAKSLDYMRNHSDDNPGAFEGALLCTNDSAGLANFIISRLENPLTRNEMLVDMQTYLPNPNKTPTEKIRSDRYDKVMARDDIKMAVEKYGYIDDYPTFG